MNTGTVVVIGGTSGIGREVASEYVRRGHSVTITGRDRVRAAMIAKEIGGNTVGLGLDLAEPTEISPALAVLGEVDHLVIAAVERDANHIESYDIARATRLVTLKLVGYAEVVHALASRLGPEASVVLFGGLALARPYAGSTTVTTVNGGVSSLIRTLACELAPVRFNAVHPGIIGDSPAWIDKPLDAVIDRTPLGRLVTMAEIVGAVTFLLDNTGVNGVNLNMDGGWLLR